LQHDGFIKGLMMPAIALADKDSEQFALFGDFHWKGSANNQFRQDMAEPDGEQAKEEGSHDVRAGVEPLALARKVERLQAERRKRGVSAADADHEKLAPGGAHQEAPFRAGKRCDKSNDERSGGIHH